MKKINRMLSILIVFLMVLSLCPLAEAEGEFEDWTKNADKVYSISKTWEIQFNMEINGDTANDTNVYVLDSDGARVPVIVEH
ncbi:MAG: hypothetical protein GX219_02240 [Tissierellia bacterium]|nr:hypothetical protein [Tissierellia bacterium]